MSKSKHISNFPRLIGRAFVAAVVLSVARAEATPLDLITNGSFELGSLSNSSAISLPAGSTVITGWTTYNAELAWISNSLSGLTPTTPYGDYHIDFTGYHDSAPYGGIRQEIATIAGASYALAFALGTNPSASAGSISVEASAGDLSQVFTYEPSGAGTQWQSFSTTFTALTTTTLIQFLGIQASGGKLLEFDDVSVVMESAAVPEIDPSSCGSALALVLGALGLLDRRRSRLQARWRFVRAWTGRAS